MIKLKLTLHKKAFEVMVTGEKKVEFRHKSAWMESRLYLRHKDGTKSTKPYDLIEFTNGYGADKPRFTAKFLGFDSKAWVEETYSNGLRVLDYNIWALHIGEIISIENYTIPATT